MKRTLLFFLIFLPMLASADAVEIGGIYYNLTEETKVAEVTKNPQKYQGDITIPESVEHEGITYSVTKIGQMAFEDCSSLTSATISNSVTSIEAWAFYGCTSLASITIPNNVTSIGVRAFYNCTSLTSVTIPNSVTSIGTNAFEHCTSLTSVTISNSLTSIGESTFQNCFSLASVTIPNSVTKIGGLAFRNCSNLASVTIPNSVTEICKEAFCNCTSLASISIPNSVTRIERYAFAACNALTSVTIGNGMKIIEGHAFYGCDAVTSVHISDLESWCKISFGDSWSNPLYFAHHFILNGVEVKDLVIPNSVTSIGDYTFYRCSDLASITIPNSVTNIERYAFAYCSGVTSITIGSKVESIGASAFSECQRLLNIYCYAENVPKTRMSNTFRNSNIEEVTLHVPAASVSTYQAAEPWKNFKEIVAITAQDDYIPFVKIGKQWNVIRSDFDGGYHHVNYRLMNEKVEKAGKTYMKMYRSEDDMAAVSDAALLREEDHKVYFFDSDMQKEFLLFDYSLKAGDTYETYSYDEQKMVSYKVLSVNDCTEGPKIVRYNYDQVADSMTTQYRYLQKWTVRRTDNDLEKTWIEGVGSLEGPLGNLRDVVLPDLSENYLAYVEYIGEEAFNNTYLPFSFYDTLNRIVHGSNMSTRVTEYSGDNSHQQLTYELEGNRLHVYGQTVSTLCNKYVYIKEVPTDDPLLRKLHFEERDIEPIPTGIGLRTLDFYVPGFDPNMNYIVVANHGEEYPVINKTPQMAYRPMIEEGKVWKVGDVSDNPVKLVEYYYFEGDTIIDGKTCKQMMCQRYVSPNHPDYAAMSQIPSTRNIGAWYEEDQKVYFYDAQDKQYKMMYDFSLNAYDTLQINSELHVIGPKQTGGLKGFKGVYRKIMGINIDSSIYTTWLEGVGGIDGPTQNVYLGKKDHPLFLISCTVGDEVIYLNDEYQDEATPERSNAPKQRLDFTHIIKTKPQAPMMRTAEQPLYGEYNDQQLGINLDPLAEAYLVRINNESGKTVYEKAVNAGNIVAITIDISAYPKGRYTVTVENSREAFTGEFETDATGIVENVKIEKVKNLSIYNLQGQRISTLQKGLNIVNGRKVYVK